MLPFIIRRLLISIVVLFVSTFGVFILQAHSGNPLATLTQRQPPPPPSTINALKDQLHLNVPSPLRYFYWLGGVLHGDLGKNINNIPVKSQIFARLGTTLELVFLAMIVALILAVLAGVISAVKQYSLVDYSTTFLGFILISIPTFWMAGLLKDVAIRINQSAGSQIFSFSGQSTPDYSGGFFGTISDRASHLILPTITLALISYASWSRYQRASMLDVLNSDYLRLARAKGVPWRKVLIRHGLRTALIPLTTVVAVGFGGIIGGAVVTETVFDWHGMGEYLLQAASTIDTNEMLAWLLMSATAVVVFNLIADILYAVLDPRIRLG
ncbi:MAG TPA: ABC transporter permease [Mycobacteriales bacterium]|jgi:peptide/nickel transport system permease protein|nr:ABC transporter permease [Mycobacteriales bacterium]